LLAGGKRKMTIFGNLFSKKNIQAPKEPEHAVIVHFKYGKTDLQPIFDLEDKLKQAILQANVGEFDGNDVAKDGSDGYLYMYGPNADKLFAVVRPILIASEIMVGATAKLRYGPPTDGIKEIEEKIG
jgi:hypothetical protein